jgi:hypothetical protein
MSNIGDLEDWEFGGIDGSIKIDQWDAEHEYAQNPGIPRHK